MRVGARLLLAILATLIPLGCDGGCGCGDGGVLAELEARSGMVERDHARARGDWEPAELDAAFRTGDGLKTGESSQAILVLTAGGKVRVEEETIIRFRDGPPGSDVNGLDVEMGHAVVRAGDQPVKLSTEVGMAVVEAGGAMRVTRGEDGLTFAVTVGRARLERANGEHRALSAGETIEIGIGAAIVDSEKAPDASTDSGPAADAGPAPLPSSITARIEGAGAAARAAGTKTWEKLPPGEATVEAKTEVRLAQGTTVSLSGDGQEALLRGAGQFVVLGGGQSLVQVLGGSASTSGSNGPVRVQAPGGVILTDASGAADIAVDKDGSTTVDVARGSARVRGKVDRATVRAGEEATLQPDGSLALEGRGLDYADLTLSAGASGVVHDPRPPSAIGFIAEPCSKGAVVELSRSGKTNRFRGAQQTNVRIPAGRHTYRVFCVEDSGIQEEAAAEGNITVVTDAGTAPLPRSAPTTQVTADGRKYTVLYQNLLPKIGISWKGAPKAPSYQLAVTSHGRRKSYSTKSPAFTFSSGSLSEGTHRMVFTTADGARSKTTTVQIRFDNAAPKASLTAPANRSFSPGEQVTVAGIALPGWKVSAGGAKLATDAQHRFRGKAAAPSAQQSLAVVFSHPRRGAHYYLRRHSEAR